MNDVSAIERFQFTLVPAIQPEQLHENMRSSIARDLQVVTPCAAHDLELSIVGGGPSLADTYQDLTGYVAAVNGSLAWLLDRGIVPQMCGICDPSPHMLDIIVADPRVTYFVASSVHPSVFDKLINAGCKVVRWNVSTIPGGEELLDEIEPNWRVIGGGTTMGLRWITLGYDIGFRSFHLHGFDSSFRGERTHAYPDHQDGKDRIEFDGYPTRPNFIGQVSDFIVWMNRLELPDVDPVKIAVYGEGLLQKTWADWKAEHPGAHEGNAKPALITDGFVWPETDRVGQATFLLEANSIARFMREIQRFGVAVQAGGNVGVYPAHLARYFSYVHTFEPDDQNYACLIKNIGLNKGNIRTYHAALGAYDGTVSTEPHERHNCGAVRVVEDGRKTLSGPVPMVTIDDLELDACDLIWLDTEGYELNALRGAERTIARHLPAIIIEENDTPALHGLPIGGARAWLEAGGYVRKARHGNDTLFVYEF